jgi:L-lactate dehydrogenase complex protein LldG
MVDSGQAAFIRRVRRALGHPADRGRDWSLDKGSLSGNERILLQRINDRTDEERQKLLEILVQAADPINLNVIPQKDISSVASAIVNLVQGKQPEWDDQKCVAAWRHPLIESLDLADSLAEIGVPLYVAEFQEKTPDRNSRKAERERLRRQIVQSFIGLTSADYCLADSATLVMKTRAGQARSISLVPSIHIAVVHLDQIIADLKELYALLKWHRRYKDEGLTNCLTFISGPSKTADVEATMVHGAHGPREVYIYVISGCGADVS